LYVNQMLSIYFIGFFSFLNLGVRFRRDLDVNHKMTFLKSSISQKMLHYLLINVSMKQWKFKFYLNNINYE